MSTLLLLALLFGSAVTTDQIYPGVDKCDSAWHEEHGTWNNPTGQTIYIKQLRVWHGASTGLMADLLGAIHLIHEDGSRIVLFVGAFDRYNPTEGSHESTLTLSPDYIELKAKEQLLLARRCGPQNHNPGGMEALQVAGFFYTLVP